MNDIEIVVFQDKSWVRLTEYQKVKEENERLKAQIEKMKCCGNCRIRGAECVALEHQGILCGKTRDKWELINE